MLDLIQARNGSRGPNFDTIVVDDAKYGFMLRKLAQAAMLLTCILEMAD
jgi:hypothetical protein